jgi:putative copper export protein
MENLTGYGLFFLLIKLIHITASTVWVGGSLFFLLVVNQSLTNENKFIKGILGANFKQIVDLCIWVLLLSGIILTVNKLTSNSATVVYGSLLGFKLALVAWTTFLIWFKKPSKSHFSLEVDSKSQIVKDFFSRDRISVLLGVIIIYISETLANLQNI